MQTKIAGQLASMRSENTTMMDAVLKKLDSIEQQGQGGRKPYKEQTPQEQGPCKRCKQHGHDRPNCTETEEKAAELTEAYYGRAQQTAPSSLTNLDPCSPDIVANPHKKRFDSARCTGVNGSRHVV